MLFWWNVLQIANIFCEDSVENCIKMIFLRAAWHLYSSSVVWNLSYQYQFPPIEGNKKKISIRTEEQYFNYIDVTFLHGIYVYFRADLGMNWSSDYSVQIFTLHFFC